MKKMMYIVIFFVVMASHAMQEIKEEKKRSCGENADCFVLENILTPQEIYEAQEIQKTFDQMKVIDTVSSQDRSEKIFEQCANLDAKERQEIFEREVWNKVPKKLKRLPGKREYYWQLFNTNINQRLIIKKANEQLKKNK